MRGSYDDIIHLPHPTSPVRPRMSLHNRAAQFSPFAALTGHGDAIGETARLTEERAMLDEYKKAELNEKLRFIRDKLPERMHVAITHFQKDQKKAGGAYLLASGEVKKIDEYERMVVMRDGSTIPIDDILEIESDCFSLREGLQP